MERTRQMFLSVAEVQGLLGMSKSYCYELVARLNDELEKMGKIVIPGRGRQSFSWKSFTAWRLQMKCLWKQEAEKWKGRQYKHGWTGKERK